MHTGSDFRDRLLPVLVLSEGPKFSLFPCTQRFFQISSADINEEIFKSLHYSDIVPQFVGAGSCPSLLLRISASSCFLMPCHLTNLLLINHINSKIFLQLFPFSTSYFLELNKWMDVDKWMVRIFLANTSHSAVKADLHVPYTFQTCLWCRLTQRVETVIWEAAKPQNCPMHSTSCVCKWANAAVNKQNSISTQYIHSSVGIKDFLWLHVVFCVSAGQ